MHQVRTDSMKKRTLAAIAAWTLFGIVGVGSACAQDDHGDTRETATVKTWRPESDVVIGLPEGKPETEFFSIEGNLEREGDIDYFRFIVEGIAQVQMGSAGTNTPHETSIRIILEDSHGRALVDSLSNGLEGETVGVAVSTDISAGGTYYVRVSGRDRPDLRRRGAPIRSTGPYYIHASLDLPGNDDHSDISHPDTATRVRVNSQVPGTIMPSRDVDHFLVDIDRAGILTVYTTGETDTRGVIIEPSLAYSRSDNDGHDRHNFQIVAHVGPGTYEVSVTEKNWAASSETYTGPYTQHVEFVADGDPPDPLSMRGALRATLLNLSPWQAWVHLYCRKDRAAPDATPADPCAVNVECRQEEGDPVS